MILLFFFYMRYYRKHFFKLISNTIKEKDDAIQDKKQQLWHLVIFFLFDILKIF